MELIFEAASFARLNYKCFSSNSDLASRNFPFPQSSCDQQRAGRRILRAPKKLSTAFNYCKFILNEMLINVK